MALAAIAALCGLLAAAAASAPKTAAGGPSGSEWPSWRGPHQDGSAADTGLISKWSPAGENLVWRADLVGRSTPVVVGGRVCANGRIGAGLTRQESVACFDAGTGRPLWQHALDVYLTAVPFSRVGWGNLTADPETGNVYALGVGGLLFCFDRDGKVVWSRSLTEELGLISGVGGRTHSPLVDEDRLIVSFVNAGWGDQGVPRHRTFAFDKSTGALRWVSSPGEAIQDTNIQTTPVVAEIGGRRLLIEGQADGWVYALAARTGEKVWSFHLSKGAINNTVAVHDRVVFATHGEENLDTGLQGRVVAIDATGSGDVTRTHELWRNDELAATFASPLYHDGLLYVVDNAAALAALDAATGKILWRHKLGTIGKASPTWADGKLYVAEVNGKFHILKPSRTGVEVLDEERLTLADGSRFAEIYGAPAVAYGRIYFAAESGLYCLGDKARPFAAGAPAAAGARAAASAIRPARGGDHLSAPAPLAPAAAVPASPAAAAGGARRILHVEPAEVLVRPGEAVTFHAEVLDVEGLPAPGGAPAVWSVVGLAGRLDAHDAHDASSTFVADAAKGFQAGAIAAQAGELTAKARVRVVPDLPWNLDFAALPAGAPPPGWIGAPGKYLVKETPAGKVLAKPPVKVGLNRSNAYIGPPSLHDYTIQADLLGTRTGLVRPDMGLVASGYVLDLMGVNQRLQLRAWDTELRLMEQVDFKWDPDVWYTMKLAVAVQGDEGLIRGKVWRRGEPEPAAWTVTARD
ncbi:MAG TPA: PQQ-binding-like beta-propeller repeat protein, partial [Thermoanaerobaculia bacterium]|nr:PQQ-binding-like beta-propeller repeat protein [Thermoanaerobaculia bacterium]